MRSRDGFRCPASSDSDVRPVDVGLVGQTLLGQPGVDAKRPDAVPKLDLSGCPALVGAAHTPSSRWSRIRVTRIGVTFPPQHSAVFHVLGGIMKIRIATGVAAVMAVLGGCTSTPSATGGSGAASQTLIVSVAQCGSGNGAIPVTITDQSNTVVGEGTLSASPGCAANISVPTETFYTVAFGNGLAAEGQTFTEGPYSYNSLKGNDWLVDCLDLIGGPSCNVS